MWKLIVIHIDRYATYEETEKECRDNLEMVIYRARALFAFLYDDKQQLVETYVNSNN